MKNPKWHRDEIILALDLYFDRDRGPIDDKNPKIIELSKILNELPVITNRPVPDKFRNANGVTLKLSNFLSIDPDYSGKGMTGSSKLDKEVFNTFYQSPGTLKAIATRIKQVLSDSKIMDEVSQFKDDDDFNPVVEGQVLYKLHKTRERNAKIVKKKKEKILKETGKLECETCVFDFFKKYGELGFGFIECHHRLPLSELEIIKETKLEDLALVCANCHRMLHKRISTLTIDELKGIIDLQQVYTT
jgi:5-methylcytosine-specific restriction enzyme A